VQGIRNLRESEVVEHDRVAPLGGRCDHLRAVPTYDYQCRSCGTVTEVIHPMTEDGPSVCEVCGGQLRRVLYPTGIIFKGSGFYSTDSRSGSSSPSSAPTASPKTSGDGGSSTDATKPSPAKPTDTKKAPTATGDASG
jgi:putative FmdB family regulatory protein